MTQIPKKYWTSFLSEVGRPIEIAGSDQLVLLGKIESTRRELEELRKKYLAIEEGLLEKVLRDWTDQEVQEAQIKSQKTIEP
jgi:hypothetical protein